MHSVRFPGESAEYRAARDELLRAELALSKQVEQVAAHRRRLPLGGVVPEDYVFEQADAKPVRLSELFEGPKDTLIIYSFMYGPKMARPCPMCTSILDGLDGQSPHVRQRANLVVAAQSPIARIHEFARERGWRNLRLVSSAGNTYNRDYHAEDGDSQLPALNVFRRVAGRVHHFYSAEMLYAPEPSKDTRHVDLIWPLWNLLDLTPEGRGSDWYPKLSYGQ